MARSDGWRINTSSVMAVEGAYILRALEKVASAAGLPSGFKVRFDTTKRLSARVDLEGKVVYISAGGLFTEAPLPPEKMDALVGFALHEVQHFHIDSDNVQTEIEAHMEFKSMPNSEKAIFRAFVNIAEDVQIDTNLTGNPVLRSYHEAAGVEVQSFRHEPDHYNLLDMWIEHSLMHNSGIILEVPVELLPEMQVLVSLSLSLRNMRWNSISRTAEYLLVWAKIKDVVLKPPIPASQQAQGQPQAGAENGDEKGGKPEPDKESEKESGGESDKDSKETETEPDADGDSKEGAEPGENQSDSEAQETGETVDQQAIGNLDSPFEKDEPISAELAEAIENAIKSDTEDITQELGKELEEVRNWPSNASDVPTTMRKREVDRPPIKPNPELAQRLERVLTIHHRLQSRTLRGQLEGKIDERHLDRCKTDGKIFKGGYKYPDGFPRTKLLIDGSGSMNGRPGEQVLEAAAALQSVVKCEVWVYGRRDVIELTRLDDGKLVHSTDIDGNTPSGPALAGLAQTMKRGDLIIHLTDGGHNAGFDPDVATMMLNKRGVNAVHLLWSRNSSMYRRLPHMVLEHGLADFPEALYQLLVDELQLGRLA